MLLPENEVEAQRALPKPSDDLLSAMSEVANHLCETLNQRAGSRSQMRVKPIEPLLPGSLDWAERAPERGVACELQDSAGVLFLFAR